MQIEISVTLEAKAAPSDKAAYPAKTRSLRQVEF